MKGKGFCIWLTGLPASGKSTIAEKLAALLRSEGRAICLLDGDALRQTVSKGLGFNRQDREVHLRRVAGLAREAIEKGEIAICAFVSPYRAIRQECRAMIGAKRFVEVFVDAPLSICEGRDAKGLYRRARKGEIPYFTGISDPYEPPLHPEITLDAVGIDPEDNARRILQSLTRKGLLPLAAIA